MEVFQKFIIDLDDFGVGQGLSHLLTIKEHYPDFKVTAFTIPAPADLFRGRLEYDKFREWAKIVAEYDWIEHGIHGFAHLQGECVKDKETCELLLTASEKMMREIGLPFAKVFKAPYWQASKEMYEVLRDRGYLVAVDRNQVAPKIDGLNTYVYSWSIDEPLLPPGEFVKGHGHFYGTNNDLGFCLPNFFSLVPPNAKFMTISEYAQNSCPS